MKTREEIELLFRYFDELRKGGLSKNDYHACIGGIGVMSWMLDLPEVKDASAGFDKMVAEQREEERRKKDRDEGFSE